MRSFINKLKRSGPSIEPCGTPAITTSDELVLLFMTTFCFLFKALVEKPILVLLKECRGL